MQLERVRAVLEVVLGADHLARQFAELANGHKSSVQQVSDRRSKDEAARLHADDNTRRMAAHQLRQTVDRLLESPRILEEGGDVLEEDSLLGEIRDIVDQRR